MSPPFDEEPGTSEDPIAGWVLRLEYRRQLIFITRQRNESAGYGCIINRRSPRKMSVVVSPALLHDVAMWMQLGPVTFLRLLSSRRDVSDEDLVGRCLRHRSWRWDAPHSGIVVDDPPTVLDTLKAMGIKRVLNI